MAKYEDEQLNEFYVPALAGGYNNYTQSKTQIEDNEIIGSSSNVEVDETFTGVKKTGGSSRVSGEISSGHGVKHLHIHTTSTEEEVISISGTVVKKIQPTEIAITGVTPTTDLDYTSFQGGNKSYFLNGSDNPFYYDGATLTSITSNLPTNGCGMVGVYYARRAYVIDKINKDQINFSGMYSPEDSKDYLLDFRSTTPYFGGYFRIKPGAGVEIIGLYEGTDGLYIGTKQGEIYKAVPDGTTGISAAQTHSVQLIARGAGFTSPFAVVQVGNDMQFAYDKYWMSLGYQQLFGNLLRAANLSKRVKPEFSNILHKDNVAAIFFNDTVYVSYGTGATNDRVLKISFKDKNYQLSAWSAPIIGWNVAKWVVYTDSEGTKHLYGGASDESYVYEYDNGSNNNGTAVSATFETKSFDCKKPGQVKYFAFIDVFYSMVYGELSYEVLIDEITSVTGTQSLGNSNDGGIGVGSQEMATFMAGYELDDDATFASLKQNNRFRIPVNFKKGQTVSVRFTNNNIGESFKINGVKIYFQEGSIYEE